MKTVPVVLLVALVGTWIYFLGGHNLEKAAPQKLAITQLMSLLAETIQGVNDQDLGLEFLYADLKLEVSRARSDDASATYVIFGGSTSFEEEHASTLTLRVVPRGADVSELSTQMIQTIKQGVTEARKAAEDNFKLQRLTLNYALDVKATAAGKAELKASDIGLTAASEISRGYNNAIKLVFRAD